MSNAIRTVTVGIIAYNEQSYLPALLQDLLCQTYPHTWIKIVLVDGCSTDNTWQIMESFRDEYLDEFIDIQVLKNAKRFQPAGWNLVIDHFTTDVLIRIDAHARVPQNFVKQNMDCICEGEYVCGGPRENIIDEDKPWKRMLLTAEQSMFGAGVASYRKETDQKKYVKSVFHAAYRREVVEKVGRFNEALIRTEDNEYHYRVRKVGYQICYNPAIRSLYQTRNSLKRMIKQKYQNGLWIGKTLFVCPGCISLFHLVPFAFVMAIMMTIILGGLGIGWPAIALWATYGVVNIEMTAAAMLHEKRNNCFIILPAVFLALHVSYGVGTIVGILHGR